MNQNSVRELLKNFKLNEEIISIEKIDVRGVTKLNAYKITTKSNIYILKDIKNASYREANRASKITERLQTKNFINVPSDVSTVDNQKVFLGSDNAIWQLETFIEGVHIDAQNLNFKNIESFAHVLAKFHNVFLDNPKEIADLEVPPEKEYTKMFETEENQKMFNAVEELSASTFVPSEDKLLISNYWKEYEKLSEVFNQELTKFDEVNFQKSLIHRDINKGALIFDSYGNLKCIIDWDTVIWGNVIQDLSYISCQYLFDINDIEATKSRLKKFFEFYGHDLNLNHEELQFIPILAEMMLTRATRWWGKRYVTFIKNVENNITPKDFEEMRQGFRNTITKWINTHHIVKELIKDTVKI